MDVSLAAFRVLRDTTRGAEGVEAIGDTAAKRDLVAAVAPETPRLLPAVHVLWQPLMAALHVSGLLSVLKYPLFAWKTQDSHLLVAGEDVDIRSRQLHWC